MENEYRWIPFPAFDPTALPIDTPMHAFEVEGKQVVVARYEGTWYAFAAKCPHAGAALIHGVLDSRGCITCPNHRMVFSIRTGANTSGEGYHLVTYPIKEIEGQWHIGFRKRKWLW